MDGKCQALKPYAEHTQAENFRICLLVEDMDDGLGKDGDHRTDQHTADHGYNAAEYIALLHTFPDLCTPVKSDNRLVALPKSEDDGERELHYAVCNGEGGKSGSRIASCHTIDGDGSCNRQCGAEEGTGSDGQNFFYIFQDQLELAESDRHRSILFQIGEEKNDKADILGNSGCHGSSGYSKAEMIDEERVKETVEDSAEPDADHGISSASFAS